MSHYESHNLESSKLPFIFKERAVHPTGGMFGSSNWHENIEIIHIVRGKGAIFNNAQVYPVSVGDIAVINANHLHTLAAGEQEMHHRYLIVDRAFCLENGFDTNCISFHPTVDDARIRELMETLHMYYQSAEEEPYRMLNIRMTVLQILSLLCLRYSERLEGTEERSAHILTCVKQAIDYIRASFDRDFSLEDVAAFVGINKYYLSREFHKYTGYPLVAYVNRTRCIMAQRMLAEDRLSIAEIGSRCGFENRSYFARSFRKYVGMSPVEYRNRNKS